MARGYKTGGRGPGTPNKLSSGVKEALEEWIIGEVPNLPKYFSKLTEKEKVDALPRYLPFVTARINGVDLQLDAAEKNKSNIDLGRLTREQRQTWYELYNLAKLPTEQTIDIDNE